MTHVNPAWKNSTCPDCRAIFADKELDLGDLRNHERHHRRRDHVAQVIGRSVASYDEREAMKRDGEKLMNSATTTAAKVTGANLIVQGHWHRDLEKGDTTDPVLTLKQFALTEEGLQRVYGDELGGAVREYWEGQW